MAYKRNVEIFEEAYTKKDDKSTLSYMARDGHRRYIPGSADPDVEPGGGSSSVPVVEVEGDTPEQELAPNTFYKFGTVDSVTSLTVTLGSAVSGIANIYAFRFTAGQDDPTITLPSGVVCNQDLSLKTGDVCEFSIQDNLALFSVWEAQS